MARFDSLFYKIVTGRKRIFFGRTNHLGSDRDCNIPRKTVSVRYHSCSVRSYTYTVRWYFCTVCYHIGTVRCCCCTVRCIIGSVCYQYYTVCCVTVGVLYHSCTAPCYLCTLSCYLNTVCYHSCTPHCERQQVQDYSWRLHEFRKPYYLSGRALPWLPLKLLFLLNGFFVPVNATFFSGSYAGLTPKASGIVIFSIARPIKVSILKNLR